MNFADLSAEQRELMALLLDDEEQVQEPSADFVLHGEVNEAPLSFAQQRLWFLNRMQPDSAAFNIAGPCRLKGQLNISALRRAVEEIVRRHQVLRARFRVNAGEAVQWFAPAAPMDVPLIDLSQFPPERRLAIAQEQCRLRALEPFDLEYGPLVQFTVYRLDDQDHLLLLVMHHIIADGWSLGVLTREFASLYGTYSQGLPPELPKLAAQYADYAIWQRKALDGDHIERQMEYWRRHLAGPLPVLELPLDHPRPTLQTFSGASEPLIVGQGLPDRLRELARGENSTLFMVLLAAFNVLLWRYTGQDDLLVGTPVAGRNRQETEPLIGLFLNNLVLRNRLDGSQTFLEFLRQVRQNSLDAFDHQDVPFERIVEKVQPSRDLSRSPLFQVMFILQVPNKPLAIPGLTLAPANIPLEQTKYELTLFLWEHKDQLEGTLEYNTDLFDASRIRSLGAHYVNLLEAIVKDPARSLAELPIMRAAERDRITREWNRTESTLPSDARLDRLFALQALANSNKVAVSFGATSLTYAQLDADSNRLAAYLQSLGVGPESLVAVCLERSAEMVTALLGVTKSGAAYIPLDPAYPSDRIEYMLTDSQAAVVLTQESLLASVPTSAAKIVCIDRDWSRIAQQCSQPLASGASGSNAAYVIYTSGSTGRPKGVVITQEAIVNFVLSISRAPGFNSTDKILAVTTLSFDIAGLELWLPLCVGGSIDIASRVDAMDARRLSRMLAEGVTVMQATPATWRLLLDSGWTGKPDLRILCGGEPLPPDLADRLLDVSSELWNMYGPTETTVWSTIERIEKNSPILIGKPIDNTAVYVLDSMRNPAPVGAVGELWIGGTGVARGYLNLPELTAERFVPDPFANTPGARMYSTGDLARFRSDGRLECLGRIDGQVKVRGFRIETGEIEVALRRQGGISEAAVVARPDGTGENRLVAYLAPSFLAASESELRVELKKTLPEYMIPSVFVFLERLPLTPNGKVDRRALPEPGEGAPVPSQATPYEAPASDLEGAIASVWTEVLGRSDIGRNINFFDLGGHSLLLAKAHLLLESRLEREIGVIDLFRFPTVASLANHLTSSVAPVGRGTSRRGARRASQAVNRGTTVSV